MTVRCNALDTPWGADDLAAIASVNPDAVVSVKLVAEAVQMFGGAGVSQDTPLARSWTHLRTLRLADGPDAVHRRQVARAELRKYTQEKI